MPRLSGSEDWDLLLAVDRGGVILRQSSGANGALGRVSGEMVGGRLHDHIHPEDVGDVGETLLGILENPGVTPPFEGRWLHRNGSWRWLETVCHVSAGSDPEEVVLLARDVTARVERGRRLADSERRFRAIVESSLEIVKVVSTSGKLLYANPAFERVYGYDPEEAVAFGMNVLEYVHPEDLPRVQEDTERTLAGMGGGADGPPGHTTEYRFLCADGSYRWIEGVGSYLLDEPGVEGVIVHARAITERRNAEDALRESEELRRAVTGGAPVILFALDASGVFTLSEGRGLAALGMRRNEVVGVSVFDLHRGHPRILENNRRALAGEEVVDTVEYKGTYFETRYSPLLDAEGRPDGAVCVATDVTERVATETETRIKDRALEASSNGVLITDPNREDNPVIYVNPAFQRMCGYEPDEILGSNCRIFQGNDRDQPQLSALAEAVAAGREHSCTIRNYRKDGTLFYNELYVAPVRDTSGRLTHFVGIQNDVTERQELEEKLAYQAFHDTLTGLPNRNLLVDRLGHALSLAGRRKEPISVLFIDLDDLKKVNDESGHEAGDLLLVEVAARLLACLREEDTVCRMGGDEFVVILENTTEAAAAAMAERVAGALRTPSEPATGARAYRKPITASLGVTVIPSGRALEYTPKQVLREADTAMYRVKHRGGAGHEVRVLGD